MGHHKPNTADEILARFRNGIESWEGYRQARRRQAYAVLSRVLEDLSFQNELSCEYIHERNGVSVRSPYPRWAKKLAYVILDPRAELAEDTRANVWYMARQMKHEYQSKAQPVTELLHGDRTIPFLSDIALELREPFIDGARA